MIDPSLLVFAGHLSQTGVAFKAEFPGVEFEENNGNDLFETIKDRIKSGQIKAPLPIWNSHEGEIRKSYALDMLFEKEGISLFWLWPKKITFICLARNGSECYSDKKIVSVDVAERQCSQFIKEKGYEFAPKASTKKAFKEFEEGSYNIVLCAPEKNDDTYYLECEEAENPVNVTTFALLASPGSEKWDATQWGDLAERVMGPARVYYDGLVMDVDDITSDEQQVFYDILIDVETINDIPKILFVAEYQENKCRLLIERNEKYDFNRFLKGTGSEDDLELFQNLGKSTQVYSERINTFPEISDRIRGKDFVRHIGDNTCFFASPALGIFIHGYDWETTEKVVCKIIDMYFEFMDKRDGSGLSEAQQTLYEKYSAEWREDGKNFIDFEDIGL